MSGEKVVFNKRILLALGLNHPDVVAMGKALATEVLRHPPLVKCGLELEATFGFASDTENFQQNITVLDAQRVLTAFDHGKVNWDKKDDTWVLVKDMYLRLTRSRKNAKLARIRTIDGKREQPIFKIPLLRMDLCSQERSVRVGAKMEVSTPKMNKVMLIPPESVRLSTRRRFSTTSNVIRGCQWNFEVARAWVAKTMATAERRMVANEGFTTGIEVETIIDWDPDNRPCNEFILTTCIGLFMKIQEVMALLTGNKSLRLTRTTRYHVPVAPLKKKKKKKPANTKKPPRNSKKRNIDGNQKNKKSAKAAEN